AVRDARRQDGVQVSLTVLLCYKNWRRQQGHLGRERARWVAIWRRRVAMECGLCRSVLIGSATRFRPVWQAGKAKWEVGGTQRWGVGRGGKKASLHHQEAVGSNAEAGMVVKAAPFASFEVPQSKLLLQFLVVALDAPPQLRRGHQFPQADRRRQVGQPVFRRLLLGLEPDTAHAGRQS